MCFSLIYGIIPTALENGYVPIDIDVSPFINEKCNKEGISKTYKLKDGYEPIFAYIGTEGYMLASELREGKQHCQKDTPAFLIEVLELARKITDMPLLVRLDSGNNVAENIGIFMEKCFSGDKVHFIVKRNIRKESPAEWLENFREVCTNVSNPREGKSVYIGETFRDVTYKVDNKDEEKTVGIRTIYEITERLSDHDGQCYVEPKVECNMYSVNVDFSDEEIISPAAYRGGGYPLCCYILWIRTSVIRRLSLSCLFKENFNHKQCNSGRLLMWN